MFYVYVLKSEKNGKHYIGSTQDINSRLKRHNTGRNVSTKNGIPWVIVKTEGYASKLEAQRREFQIKSYKGGQAFKKLIKKK